MARILVVDDEPAVRRSLASVLECDGHDVQAVGSAEEAASLLTAGAFDLVVSELLLPGRSGLDLLETARSQGQEADFVLMGAERSLEDAVRATQLGARDFVEKPFETARFRSLVEKALAERASHARTREAESQDSEDAFQEIVGTSRAMRDLLELVRKVARTDSTALITGETGTGKELIGRAIHRSSARRSRVFCALNSAAFPETLLESELFGHRRGAFTGASANKKGLFEHADRGTVFLDEVAEMPLSMQAKLLRFLQTGEIRPIGSEHTRCVDVRLVTATNKDLEREVEEGRFREDLYYRLAVIPIHLPPLRERIEDIPLLANHFLRRVAGRLDKPIDTISAAAMSLLMSHPWPGNVRELENCIERGVALCGRRSIEAEDLPERLRQRSSAPATRAGESLEAVERIHILNTLERVGWNRKKAAQVLCISTTTLWRRLKEFGIEGGAPGRGEERARAASG